MFSYLEFIIYRVLTLRINPQTAISRLVFGGIACRSAVFGLLGARGVGVVVGCATYDRKHKKDGHHCPDEQ